MNWLLDLISLVSSLFGLLNRRDELKNTPKMREAAQAQDAVTLQSQSEKAVAQKDEKEIRRLLAE